MTLFDGEISCDHYNGYYVLDEQCIRVTSLNTNQNQNCKAEQTIIVNKCIWYTKFNTFYTQLFFRYTLTTNTFSDILCNWDSSNHVQSITINFSGFHCADSSKYAAEFVVFGQGHRQYTEQVIEVTHLI